MKKNILVFPCGSEIGLEVLRSLKYSTHFHVIGASSISDHGEFVFEDYISGIPYQTDPNFIETLSSIVKYKSIDAIYPAMDVVARTLKQHESKLGCRIIGSSLETTTICASKHLTYSELYDSVSCPDWFRAIEEITVYPVFIKPDEGYGSRNVGLAQNEEQARAFVETIPHRRMVFCELLPGNEYTIDCFSDRNGKLLFYGARERERVRSGISVRATEAEQHSETFRESAKQINAELQPRGAWFFQMKEDRRGQPKLLEVAARFGGSSSYFRAKGVNFALLSCFDAFGYSVAIEPNQYKIKMDRALDAIYKIDIQYETVYVDFDGCLVVNGKVNTRLVAFLYQALNNNKKLILLTRYEGDIRAALCRYKVGELFEEVWQLRFGETKAAYMQSKQAILIDGSYAERAQTTSQIGIPVFSPDMIEMLQGACR